MVFKGVPDSIGDSHMRKVEMIVLAALCSLALAGCGDVNVTQPGRPVIVEEKKDRPVIVEEHRDAPVVVKPVIVEKTPAERPAVAPEKK
jgi:hypothetical protein